MADFVDSPNKYFREIGYDVSMTGTVLDIVRRQNSKWILIIENKKNEKYRVYINPDKYGNKVKINATYHFIGVSTAIQEGYMGLRLEKLIDISAPVRDKELFYPYIEEMMKVFDKTKGFINEKAMKYKDISYIDIETCDSNLLRDLKSEFESLWEDVSKDLRKIADRADVCFDVTAKDSDDFWECLEYMDNTVKSFIADVERKNRNNYLQYEYEKNANSNSTVGTRGIVTNSLTETLLFAISCGISKTRRELKGQAVASSHFNERQSKIYKDIQSDWKLKFDLGVVPILECHNSVIENDMKELIFEQFECNEDEFYEWLDSRE